MEIEDLKGGDVVEAKIGLSDWHLVEIKKILPDHIICCQNIDDFWCASTKIHKNHFKGLRKPLLN